MVAPVALTHADGAEWDRGTPGMHPHLRRLKQPKPVWLQFVHDRDTRYEQHQKLQYTGHGALWLVLVYEDEHDCANGADSERINHIGILRVGSPL